ncbi:MAG: hypothetical protein CL395_06965 [Acidiferrobacteraceae bacterium]|nr:hypothetical protein [Acidiferrobacteraceae bacterium]HJP06136.1 hypothetical protein [Arenicellales bacterium]
MLALTGKGFCDPGTFSVKLHFSHYRPATDHELIQGWGTTSAESAIQPADDRVGEMDVMGNQPWVATLRTTGRVRCLRIHADDLPDLINSNPRAWLNVLRQRVDQLTRAVQTIEFMQDLGPAPSARLVS